MRRRWTQGTDLGFVYHWCPSMCGGFVARAFWMYAYDDVIECQRCGATWLYCEERSWDAEAFDA